MLMLLFTFLGYHGKGGPMKVADLQMTPLVESFLNSGRELGYDITDVNGPQQIGLLYQCFNRNFFLTEVQCLNVL